MKQKKPEEKKALEKLVKDSFCGLESVVGCPYSQKAWCPKTCGFYKRAEQQVKYWNH